MIEKSNAERLADGAHLGYRVGWQREAAAELRRIPELERQRGELLEALKNVTVHLIAAHSLLQRGGKKAAPSDTMFEMMLKDYEKSFEDGRATIATIAAAKEPTNG